MDFQSWLRDATRRLAAGESPKRDAEILLGFVTGRARTFIMAFGETLLTAGQLQQLEILLARREQGEPVAYLTGEREFWSLPLSVSPATLIPRPDTECLVEQALIRLPSQPVSILDLGTGTGAIALALASERPDCKVTGVDLQPDAVRLAQHNAQKLNILNARFLPGSWFSPVAGERFALIASNPPYIDAADPPLAKGDVRFEPSSALVAENAGLADLAHIIQAAPAYLHKGGWLLLEHGWQQATDVQALLRVSASGSGSRYTDQKKINWLEFKFQRKRTMVYVWIKNLHLLTITLSIASFVLRLFWKWAGSAMMQKRWVKTVPHIVDTVLLLSGISLIFITHFYPFSPQGTWLTEKIFGVIIYIALGFVALSKRPVSQNIRWLAFILALACLYLILKLALTKIPLLMG
ncbi:Release factor glutamine methyltransferase [Rahnella aquatilis]|nr:Release factor glutamine methyltransferase [Rahnella aquatilis]